jgi:hypothetical protein
MARKHSNQVRVWTSAAVLGWLALVIVSPADGNAAGVTAAGRGPAAPPAGAVDDGSVRVPLQSAGLPDGSPRAQDAGCIWHFAAGSSSTPMTMTMASARAPSSRQSAAKQ